MIEKNASGKLDLQKLWSRVDVWFNDISQTAWSE